MADPLESDVIKFRLMTTARWTETVRILLVGAVTVFYWRGVLPLPLLYAAIASGLYPLVKTGFLDLIRYKKIGTEIFVTVAIVIAVIGKEYVAGSVLMTIILIAVHGGVDHADAGAVWLEPRRVPAGCLHGGRGSHAPNHLRHARVCSSNRFSQGLRRVRLYASAAFLMASARVG